MTRTPQPEPTVDMLPVEDPAGAPPGRLPVLRRDQGWGRRVRWTRHTMQAGFVGVVAWQTYTFVAAGGSSPESLCPLGGFETAWTWVTTGRTVPHVHPANLVLAAALLALAIVGRGFFCGWMCPLGSVQEWLHALGQAAARRVPVLRRLRRRLSAVGRGRRWRAIDRLLRWGRWLVLAWALIGAAISGVMVFRDVDPWIALVSMAEFEFSLAFVVLLATVVLSLFVERPFCRYACPLGAVQAIAGRISPIAVQRDAQTCAGCDLCNQACPMAIPVNSLTRVTHSACTGCLECVAACPSQPALGVTLAIPRLPVPGFLSRSSR
jgi:NAD-dependent dihydropyrimidine dehydrogenase PreA subunit